MRYYFQNRAGTVVRVLGARDADHARRHLEVCRPDEGWRTSGRRHAATTYRIQPEVRRKPRLQASRRPLEAVQL